MGNNSFDTHDVKRVCEAKLEINFRDAKEYNGWYILDGKKAARITVPKGRKSIPPKTYSSMASQLLLTKEEFDSLLECPLSHADYIEILRKQVDPQQDPAPPSKIQRVNEAITTGKRVKCELVDGRIVSGFCLSKVLPADVESFALMNDVTWKEESIYLEHVTLIDVQN